MGCGTVSSVGPRRELPESLGQSFSVARAREAGIGRGRLRGADLTSSFHGARARSAPTDTQPSADEDLAAFDDERRRVRALAEELATVMAGHAFFAGITAAMIHGIPLPAFCHSQDRDRDEDGPRKLKPLVVGVHKPRSPVRRVGVRGIHLTPELAPVDVVDGLRVTDRAATWAMLGAELNERDLVAAADHLLRVPRHPGGFRRPKRGPYASREQLAAAIVRRRGAERLRTALARARTGASSPRETLLRLVLVDGGLDEPALDYDVVSPTGAFVACLDLAYPPLKLGLEYDGPTHRTNEQFERDVAKGELLTELGWEILHFTARDFRRDERDILDRVRAAIDRQRARKV